MNVLPLNETTPNDNDPSFISNVTIEKSSPCLNSTTVNIRFTITLAVPAESSSSIELPILQANRRVSEVPKVQGYYRIEYSLIPGEANIGFDIAVYRTAAKIYPDNQEGQFILTWEDDNENVWVVWNHIHQLELTREYLSALLSHPILVKIWDGKEFCNVRTRLDKPRIGRALSSLLANADEENPTKKIVQNIAQNYADKWVSKTMLYKLHRRLPIEIPAPSTFLQREIDQTENSRISTASSVNILREKSVKSPGAENTASIDGRTPNMDRNAHRGILKNSPDENATELMENNKQKRGSKMNKQSDEKKEKGAAQLIVPNKLIFAGFKTITCRLDDDPAIPKTIEDCFVSITFENHQLLHEALANQFNPLTITISHVENMPSTPVSLSELKQRCEPVYCCYQLFNQPMHQTEKKVQGRHIYWNDLNLYLMNLIDENIMSQFRNSPILNIEVHDRDERENGRRCVGSVFGSENTDEIIGKVSSKMSLLKPKGESNWHPHGCVKIDLSELWLGQTSLEFYIPVVPCHAPESGRATNVKRVENQRIQQGDFLSSGTQLQILVKLAKPLVPPVEHRLLDDRQLPTTTIAPFTRIVFVFSYDNTKFLTALETSIRTLNAKALDFDQHPAHVQIAALSTYKLTEAQQTSHHLNIITGFHLFDDEQHLFVLEGRKEDAIDVLYKQLPKPEGQKVEILYDSSVHFNERLYVKLGVDLTHIKLCRTLRDIVSQPLIFIRDMLSKETFEALDKLHQLVHVHKLSSSARYHLFPSIEMITALNRDFGVPLNEKEIKLFSTDDRAPSASTFNEKQNNSSINHWNTMTQLKEESIPMSEHVRRPDINFLERNIDEVRMTSLKNKETPHNDDHFVFMSVGPVYPYSSQKLNSSENALAQLRTYLKQHHRSSSCSFNPDYRSGTYSPYSNEETVFDFHRALRSPLDFNLSTENKDKYAEKTVFDWVTYPGHRSSRQSNAHPRSPDPARLEELSKPPAEWYEQSLHSRLSPTVAREPFKWLNRKEDFDRWTRTSPSSQQTSAHWQSPNERNKTTTVTAEQRMHFLRRSPQTELTTTGRLSATQLDRLTGILKDKPVKKGLLLPKSYSRNNGAQSAPLTHQRSLTNTPDRRIRSTTTLAFRKNLPV